MKSSPKKSPEAAPAPAPKPPEMPLGAMNYLIIALGALAVAFSYAGMYLEREVDGFFSLNVAPILLVLAYLGILVGIFYRKSGK